jgi:Flp pilus assembly CpaF family ATPase
MTSILNGRANGADVYLSESWDNPCQRFGWLDDEAGSATVDFAIVRRIQTEVNAELDRYGQDAGPGLDRGEQRQLAIGLIGERTAAWADAETAAGSPPTQRQEAALAEAVLAAMFGLGRIEQLLRDDEVEEIFINGAAPAIKRFADGHSETVAPVAESDDDLLEQLRSIATYHGQNERAVTSTWPFLNLRLPDGSRLAAQWSITPHPQVTIRRHRFVDVTLDQLTDMGMISKAIAAFLAAAVAAHRSMLIVGSPGAGKTTLLRALARCLPDMERFATLETEYELLLHELPGRFPLILPAEARPATGERSPDGRAAGEVTLADIFPELLRHGLERVLIGEVRGPEVIPMLAAMSRGMKGSMATFHADSATGTFEALASLLGEHKPNWNHAAAMAQIATAVDVIVYIDTLPTAAGRKRRFVSDIVEVGPIGENGQPVTTGIFAPDPDRPDDPRGYPLHLPEDQTWCRRAGFDLGWLAAANGGWARPWETGDRV